MLAVAVFLLAFSIYHMYPAEAAANYGPCDAKRWMRVTREEWTPRLMKGLIRCAVDRWPVPGGKSKAIAVAQCESGLWPWAVGGDNIGLYQHKKAYWFDRVDKFLKRRWFKTRQWDILQNDYRGAFIARANVILSIRMVHSSWSWSAWSCA